MAQSSWLEGDTDRRAIDNFIVRLWRYLEADPNKPKHLVTVRGIGYKFVSEQASEAAPRSRLFLCAALRAAGKLALK